MSFRKRNIVLSTAQPGQARQNATTIPAETEKQPAPPPGLRPSPVDGRLTTSTGTYSLDQLLAGHAGLPTGTSLLIEEQGTTDFSGILLRYYAAEGVVQGHHVHVLGLPPSWRYDLPGLADPARKSGASSRTKPGSSPSSSSSSSPPPEDEAAAAAKMKIAWRYNALANTSNPDVPAPLRNANASPDGADATPFCHAFDLSRRLAIGACKGTLHTVAAGDPMALDTPTTTTTTATNATSSSSPFSRFIHHLHTSLAASSTPTTTQQQQQQHRAIVPALLSPSAYPASCARPGEVLAFLHALRALLREYPTRLSVMVTLPVALFPRATGLTRWIELLCDGVVELVPLPSGPLVGAPGLPGGGGRGAEGEGKKGTAGKNEKDEHAQPQGLVVVHTLPVYHEKGGGGGPECHFRENLAFSLSASRGLVIRPYSLPPLGEETAPAGTGKEGIDF